MKNLVNTDKLTIDIVSGFGMHIVYWEHLHIMIGCFSITIEI
jgi:hypothetical protein